MVLGYASLTATYEKNASGEFLSSVHCRTGSLETIDKIGERNKKVSIDSHLREKTNRRRPDKPKVPSGVTGHDWRIKMPQGASLFQPTLLGFMFE